MKKLILVFIILLGGCQNTEKTIKGIVYTYDDEYRLLAIETDEKEIYWISITKEHEIDYDRYAEGYIVQITYSGTFENFIDGHFAGGELQSIDIWEKIPRVGTEINE